MPFLNGFDAWIVVGAISPWPTYGVVIDQPHKTVTCWIPSKTRIKYKVGWGCEKGIMDSRGDVYIDGKPVGSEVIHRSYKAKLDGTPSLTEKAYSTLGDPAPFRFPSNLDIGKPVNTSTMDSQTSPNQHPNHGEIRLIISRVDLQKAMSSSPVLHTDIVEHIATFVFRYRSYEFLQNNRIIAQKTRIISAMRADVMIRQPESISFVEGSSSDRNIEHIEEDEDMEDEEDEAQIDSKIQELQEKLNELYAQRISTTRVMSDRNIRKPRKSRVSVKRAAKWAKQREISRKKRLERRLTALEHHD